MIPDLRRPYVWSPNQVIRLVDSLLRGYRRDYLRALAQRVEVDAKELRIMGLKSELLRTLVAASSAKTAGFGVPSVDRRGVPTPIGALSY